MAPRLDGPGDAARTIDREIVVGREGDVVVADPEVSRRHVALRPVSHGVEIEDLGSSNGTFVNGERIRGKVVVSATAQIRVGDTQLSVEISDPQVTRARAVPVAPDVTRQHQVPAPEVTAVRKRPPVADGPPVGGPPAGGPPAGGPPAGMPGKKPPAKPAAEKPADPSEGGGKRRPVGLLLAGLVGAAIAVALVLVLGGGDDGNNGKTTASGNSRCAGKFPPLIHDGFPEPTLRFSKDGVLDTSLHMAPADLTFDGVKYDTGFLYDKQLPGPTLVVCPGDTLAVKLFNGLPLPTNLHVHGLHVSPEGQGDNVFVDVKSLTSRQYRYKLPYNHEPGFYWYHPHLHPLVQPEEAGGLAGGIIVEGGLDDVMPNIPQRLIIVQGGNRRPPAAPPAGATGASGPSGAAGAAAPAAPPAAKNHPPVGVPPLIVNGAQDPVMKIKPGEIQRWRILNATSDRLLKLAMPGVTFQLLANDGNTLQFMRPENQLLVNPGSRVEVLVKGGPKGLYTMSALPFHQCRLSCNPFAGPTTGVTTPKEDLFTMVSTGDPVSVPMPSGAIGNPPDLRNVPVDVHRTLLFSQQPFSSTAPPNFEVDNKIFASDRTDVTMKLNSVEEWTLTNPKTKALEYHTFHIHQNPFQIISINGKKLDYIDWQDNVVLPPRATIVIRMRPTDFTGRFVFHCHVIFHEDHGMMGTVQVEKNPAVASIDTNRVMYLTPPTRKQLLAEAKTEHLPAKIPPGKSLLYYCRLLASGQGVT